MVSGNRASQETEFGSTIFFRVVQMSDKASALCRAVQNERISSSQSTNVFKVATGSFAKVPGSPFAYWISDAIRRLFTLHEPFEQANRIVRQGGVTGDDKRFLRLYWEVPLYQAGERKYRWVPFAKGGNASHWYADYPIVVAWDDERTTFFGYTGLLHRPSEKPSSADHYFRPGLTWPLRASRFAPVPLPEQSIFSIRGYAILAPKEELLAIAAVGNSVVFDYLFKVTLGRFGFPEFVVGVLQKLPFPSMDRPTKDRLTGLAYRAWALKRSLHNHQETDRAFVSPVLTNSTAISFAQASRQSASSVRSAELVLTELHAEIDDVVFGLYGIHEHERVAISQGLEALAVEPEDFDQEAREQAASSDDETDGATDIVAHARDLLSWAIGVAVGRFDLRLSTGERDLPSAPDPFDQLRACSPGMLIDTNGLPYKRPPEGYPIAWPDDGVLTDDPGIDGVVSNRDIVSAVRRVIEVVWRNKSSDIEQELCGLLKVGNLRDYLRKPSGYFEHHLRRYSKSNRKAPIYWPLSTPSGQYTVWIYCHCVTADTLFKVVSEHVVPTISSIEDRIARLERGQTKQKGSDGARATKELSELAELAAELKDMREELLRVAKLPYKPDLNDGVQITAAPLWRLFRLPRWRSELEKTWKALEKGEYDWAHLAYAIWPDRVKEKCKTDKSLAIAHGLESLYQDPRRPGASEASSRRGTRRSKR